MLATDWAGPDRQVCFESEELLQVKLMLIGKVELGFSVSSMSISDIFDADNYWLSL